MYLLKIIGDVSGVLLVLLLGILIAMQISEVFAKCKSKRRPLKTSTPEEFLKDGYKRYNRALENYNRVDTTDPEVEEKAWNELQQAQERVTAARKIVALKLFVINENELNHKQLRGA